MEKITGFLKYVSNERLEDIFDKHTIRFTQPMELNDPLEFNPILKGYALGHHSPFIINGVLMPSHEALDRKYLLEQRLNEYGILSLTKNGLSYDMWSRYANGHKGFIIELAPDFNKHKAFVTTTGFPNIEMVEYVERYEIDLNSFINENGDVHFESFDRQAFFKKTKHWKDEEEYRFIKKMVELKKKEGASKIYLNELPLDVVISVTFGALMGEEDKINIVKKCKDRNIHFLQSIIYRDQPDNLMGLWPLSDLELFEKILKWKPYRFVMEKSHFQDALNTINLRSL